MDDDQEHERFDVDNDYEGGEWIDGEFFYANKRQKRTQTKDDQIYGIFAEDSDDEDRGRRRGGLGNTARRGADYTKPVNFVGGGVVKHGPDSPDDETQLMEQDAQDQGQEDEGRPGLGGSGFSGLGFASAGLGSRGAPSNDDDQSDQPSRGGIGLGFTPSGSGLGLSNGDAPGLGSSSGGGRRGIGLGIGFQPNPAKPTKPQTKTKAKASVMNGAGVEEDKEEAETEFLPTAFGRRIQAQAEQRRKQRESDQQQQQQQHKQRVSTKQPVGAKDVGSFEQFTKGIGAKLLSKMGWQEGKGLGKDGKGIAKPLEAKMRPKGVGMGFGDRREPQMMLDGDQAKLKEREKTEAGLGAQGGEADVKKEATMWKRKNAEARVKRTFKTADEVVEAAERHPSSIPLQTIIDMRGPQTRIVTNLQHLDAEGKTEAGGDGGGAMPMPELQHNIRLLVDMAEADIQKLDARVRHQKDTVAILEKEVERLTTESSHHAQHAQGVAHLMERVSWARSGQARLSELLSTFQDLHANYQEEYVVYDISAIALAAVLPFFTNLAVGWSPLKDPGKLAPEFGQWKVLLQTSGQRHAGHDFFTSSDPYMRLVLELVLPPLRKDLTNSWDPRDAAALEKFIESWERVLPPAVLTHIMLHLVLPRLKTGVQSWDPITDPIALHTWIHPWLPFLGSEINELLPTIRFKFTSALQEWHPADESAHIILAPWHKVFHAKDWELLLTKSIAPKLAAGLHEMVINPAEQDVEPFEWAMAWIDVMPTSMLASLLEVHFFPKWHTILRHWLANSPDYDEVTRWYLGWKALFPEDLLHHQRVKTQMNAAMNVMNAAAQGKSIPPTWTPANAAAATAGGAGGLGGGLANNNVPLSETYGAPHAHPAPMYRPPAAGTVKPKQVVPAFDASELTLRELVAQFAEEQGIEFLPKPGRMHEGMQVYHFGLVSCVVDNSHSMIRALVGERWQPTSMEGLVQEHTKRLAVKQKGRR